MKRIFVLGLFLCIYIIAWAASFTTQADGAWNTGSTWSGNSAPADWQLHTATVNHNVTVPSGISGFTSITLNNGKSFTSGSVGSSQNLTLTQITNFNVVNGNITVYGDLTLTNTSTLTITAGSLTVTGKLTLSGSSIINFNSTGSISVGSFETSGSGGTVNLNNGSMTVTNGISLGSDGAINVAQNRTLTAGSFTSSNNTTAVLNNSGTVTISGVVNAGGPINNLSTGTINISGNVNMTASTSSVITNSGVMDITGTVNIPSSAKFKTNPGGRSIVRGNVTLSDNENLVIGTAVAPTPYADMVITGNLTSSSSGDVKIDQNGRFALFGNFSGSGGGVLFTVENGGQTYVHGNLAISGSGGGGNNVINNNTSEPWGLYVNGSTSAGGGGSSVDSNVADLTTLRNTNVPFYNWVATQPGSPFTLPIELLSFTAEKENTEGIFIRWSTSTEKNFSHFELEHSADGKTFRVTNIQHGAGNSNTKRDYGFLFTIPVTGKNYFRLKSVDLDDSYKYSQVISLVWDEQVTFSVYPNPVLNKFFKIRIDEGNNAGQLYVIDQLGRVAYGRTEVDAGMDVQLPSDLEPGAYLVRLVINGKTETVRIAVK